MIILLCNIKKINQGGESYKYLIVGDKFNLPVLKQLFSLYFGQQNNDNDKSNQENDKLKKEAQDFWKNLSFTV